MPDNSASPPTDKSPEVAKPIPPSEELSTLAKEVEDILTDKEAVTTPAVSPPPAVPPTPLPNPFAPPQTTTTPPPPAADIRQLAEKEPSPPPAKSFTLPIILILLLVTAIGAGSYYFLQYQKLAQAPQLTPAPVPSITPSPDPTAGWQTYFDSNSSISFNYPPTQTIEFLPRDGGDGFTYLFMPENTINIVAFTKFAKPQSEYYMDSPSNGTVAIGSTLWKTYFLPQGYPDGAVGAGNPIFALQAEIRQILVSVTLNNQSSLSDEARQILSTLKFTDKSVASDQPTINTPLPNSIVISPLTISGTVPSGWMFEGSFPIKLTDDQGTTLATATASQDPGEDWMSGNPTQFTTTLTFTTTATSGFIVLSKDNPSGLPENDQEYRIPVNF